MDLAHALAATTGHRLEKDRESVFIDEGLQFGEILERFDHPGNQGNTRLDGELAAFGLGAHEPDGGGWRPDPGQPRSSDPLGELGVLGQKAITGVNEVCAARIGGGEQTIHVEIAL